jgi:hypothetical protein
MEFFNVSDFDKLFKKFSLETLKSLLSIKFETKEFKFFEISLSTKIKFKFSFIILVKLFCISGFLIKL